ncbi:MAG TPA: hypothetical protein VE914_00215 [Candidatus Angelobacter sp.]|nr:hypothetical protein [Candidatus Angelobacter sp.]
MASLLLLWGLSARDGFSYSQWNGWFAAVTPLALAALAQTPILLAGGQGLAAGGLAVLCSAVAVQFSGPHLYSAFLASGCAIAVGAAAGALNGLLIGRLALRSTIVTLGTGAAALALSIWMLDAGVTGPPEALTALLRGDAVVGLLPVPAVLLAVIGLAWVALDRSAVGRAIRAAGVARAQGISDPEFRGPVFLAYLFAGAGYGVAGLYLAAELGPPDPFAGGPTLLQIYAAVALGGTVTSRRQGSAIGSLIGAAVVITVDLVALSFGFDTYVVMALEGGLLLLAASIGRRFPAPAATTSALQIRPPLLASGWLDRGRLAWLLALAAVALIAITRPGSLSPGAANEILTSTIVMIALALGQGCVMLIGGIDLTAPVVAAVAGLVIVNVAQQDDGAMLSVVAIVLVGAAAGGAVMGWSLNRLRLNPILGTLAVAGVIQAIGIFITIRLPPGSATPLMLWVASPWRQWPAPAVLALAPCFITLIGVLHRSGAIESLRRFGRNTSGMSAPPAVMAMTYAGSSVMAALAGILLACYGGSAQLAYTDVYLLPTLLALQLGGVAFGGGRGGLWGALGGVLFVALSDALLLGAGVGQPARLGSFALLLVVVAWLGSSRRSQAAANAR